jgi:hypothetical protein
MACKAWGVVVVLALVVAVNAQRPGLTIPVDPPGGALNLPAAPTAPVAGRPKATVPAPIYAPESSINFNWGYLTVRAGCCLRSLGPCPVPQDKCNDADDQGTWQEALRMWANAGDSWVDTCTAKGTQKMAAGCKPELTPIKSYGPKYIPKANTWVQYWLKKQLDLVSASSVMQNALLDVRYNKMWLHQSVFEFIDGFVYVANGGALGLNETNINMEDSYDGEGSQMGAAAIGVRAKIGCIKSNFELNKTIFGWDSGKIWLIDSSYKQHKGAFIVENTSFTFTRSQMSFWDMDQGHVAKTTWNLTNSQVNLVRSTIRVWDSTIILSGSHINLNESRLLLSNTVVLGDNFAFSTVNVSENFGVTLGQRLDALSVNFKVEAEDGKIVLKAKKQEQVTNSGR